MQGIDCPNFKELLDSYLCEELAVETNHAMLRHVEHCGSCRNEMVARRQLRLTLRRACSQEMMSNKAVDRLRVRLRGEAEIQSRPVPISGWREWFAGTIKMRTVFPAAVTVGVALLFGGLWALNSYRSGVGSRNGEIASSKLSDALMEEAAGDHLSCAGKFIAVSSPAKIPDSIRNFDPAYVGLEQVAEAGANDAGGLQLRSAHICGFKTRRFVHLVYLRSAQLISLLVTERDNRALKTAALPNDDGSQAGMQKAMRDSLALGAFQTKKHIVLVVSGLSEAENITLAERLATPVAAHLRRVEVAGGGQVGGMMIYRFDGFSDESLMSRCDALKQ